MTGRWQSHEERADHLVPGRALCRKDGAGGTVVTVELPGGDAAAAVMYKGRTYFALERTGAPSRWNTLRALRVLRWWDGEGR